MPVNQRCPQTAVCLLWSFIVSHPLYEIFTGPLLAEISARKPRMMGALKLSSRVRDTIKVLDVQL